MNSPAASLAFSLSPNSSERVHVHDENLSFSDRSSRYSSPKGLRLALSPLSPLGSSMNSNSYMKMNNRDSSTEKRQIVAPTRRNRRGISSLTHSSASYVSKTDEEVSSATKKARFDPDLNTSTPPAQVSTHATGSHLIRRESNFEQKAKSFESPMSIFDFESHIRRAPLPTAALVQEAYNLAMQPSLDPTAPMNDQQKLRISGCNLLSFEDVILPAIFTNVNNHLKYLEGKAKGYNDSVAVLAFQHGRIALLKCIDRTYAALWKCRDDEEKAEKEQEARMKEERKRQREQKRLEEKLRQEQLAKERETAKALLLMQRQAEAEKRKRDRKKNLPRNKELWNEVALLMADLHRLEKEEKAWKEASDILDKLEAESKERIQKMQSSVVQDDRIPAEDAALIPDQSLNIDPILDHCAVSASRIKCMTESIEVLAGEAESVRKTLYDSYNNHHKFKGYLGAKDPKALIRALALE